MARELEDDDDIEALVKSLKRVAVLGIKTEAQRGQAAFYVPEYLQGVGVEVVPVPVYYPEVTQILGQPVFRKLVDVPGAVDLVNVFRRSQDIPPHVDDIIARRPRAVWFQLGIRNDEAAKKLIAAGIDVVQDKCLLVEHRRFAGT